MAPQHAGDVIFEKAPAEAPKGMAGIFSLTPTTTSDVWDIQLERHEVATATNKGDLSARELRSQEGRWKQQVETDVNLPETATRSQAILPVVGTEFSSTAGNNLIPPDNCMAISQNGTIVTSNNSRVQIFNDSGTSLYNQTAQTFWGPLNPTSIVYDPKVLYNAAQNKFVLVALHGTSSSVSDIFVAFSVSENPSVDGWWLYSIDANDGDTNNWFDYPSIAHTTEDLYVSGNMFNNAGNFQSSRMFSIQMLGGFTGQSINWVWWSDIDIENGNNAATVKPLQYPFGNYGPGVYAVSANGNSFGSDATYFFTNNTTLNSPTLTAVNVDVDNWSGPSNAAQSGSTNMLDVGGSRIRSGFFGGNGKLHYAHTIDNGSGFSELRYTIIDVDAGTAQSSDFGAANFDYSYPWIVPWATSAGSWDGGAMVGFLRVCPTCFPEFRVANMDASMTWSNSVGIQGGSAPIVNGTSGTSRWGDYIGGCWREGQSNPEVWFYGQHGTTGNTYGTWVAEILGGVEGCTDPNACNFNPDADINVGCDYSCFGCTSPTACNYDASATNDDGSCTFPGCLDSNACNYDETAGCSSGECCYDNCVVVTLSADGLFGGQDIDFTITDQADGSEVVSGSNGTLISLPIISCIVGGCYTIDVDIESTGTFTVVQNSVTLVSGSSSGTFDFVVGDGGMSAGCTDAAACNYDPDALCDSGQCCYNACMEVEMTDAFGDGWTGNTWQLTDPADGTVVTSGTLENGAYGVDWVCVDPGCYDFEIVTGGSFPTEIGFTLNGVTGGPYTGDSTTGTIRVTIGDGGEDVGCLDPTAANYDPTKFCEDNTLCCYEYYADLTMLDGFGDGWNGGVLELRDSYGTLLESYTFSSGSEQVAPVCVPAGCYTLTFVDGNFPDETSWTIDFTNAPHVFGGGASSFNDSFSLFGVDGCTDVAACNYSSAATCEDGSCTYPGCNDPDACNFDASAGCDNGSCAYGCFGCTYASAENYSASATKDDGSCTFQNTGTSCDGDADGDGQVGTNDILIVVGAFGTACP